jgi:cytochrome b561
VRAGFRDPINPGATASTPAERYGSTAIALHWAIAALILVNFPIGFFNEAIETATGASPMWLHKSLGLTVLVLSVARLAWRLAHPPPPLPETLSGWRASAAAAVHWTFYALIVLVPLSGWLRTSGGTYPLVWFGLIEVPKFPIVRDSPEAGLAAFAHVALARTMLMLVALHVAAALHHHFVLRDRVLRRMLPLR